ncbi:MAG: DoxX family protein [bacterium]|nr:DoxX family protein [bacterium]
MNIFIWILQGMLAGMYVMAGSMKLRTPKEQLALKMGWANDFSQKQIKLIGTAEILGALGLIFPLWLGIVPVLTPLAASGLVLLMLGASGAHLRRKEMPMAFMTVVLAIVLAFVAIQRF